MSKIKDWVQSKYRTYKYMRRHKARLKHIESALTWSDGHPCALYFLLAKKLESVLDYAEKESTDINRWNIKMLKVAIKLAWHFSFEEEEQYYPDHINMNNLKRFIPEREWHKYDKEPNYFKIRFGRTGNIGCYFGKWGNHTREMRFYDIKAKHLLFSIIETYNDDFWCDN